MCVFVVGGENGGREEQVKEARGSFCEIERQLRSYIRGSVDGFTACLGRDHFFFFLRRLTRLGLFVRIYFFSPTIVGSSKMDTF